MRTKLPAAPLAVILLSGTLAAQQPAPKGIASVKELHSVMISPASDAIFDVGRETPKTAAAWAALRNQAIILAEAGNLLMMEPRAKDKDRWMIMARALVDATAEAVKAINAKNPAAVNAAGDKVVMACEDCHAPYRDNGRKMR